MLSSSGRPANPSPSPAAEADWMIRAVTWPWSPLRLLNECVPVGSSSRTFLGCYRAGPGGITPPSSGKWPTSGIAHAGGCLTLNTSESHNGAVVSSLSDILEIGDLPPQYYLSRKACAGVLRRAAKRRKTLPAPLRAALEAGVAPDNNTSGPIQVATAVNAHGGPHGRLDFESETFIVHALRGEGFDGSEDGTGRGTPLIPVMAFSGKNNGADARIDLAPTLRAMPHAGSHANAGGQVAVTVGTGVRRLTPRECSRLMGFPDDWTAIDWRGRPAPDGRQYKALGNSMAVPVLRWLLDRLVRVDGLLETGGRVLSPPGPPLRLPPETPLRELF